MSAGTATTNGRVLVTEQARRGLVVLHLQAVAAARPGKVGAAAVPSSARLTARSAAEQWIGPELRQLHSDGWRVVNHFLLTSCGIGHVMAGSDGAVSVESKRSYRDSRTRQTRPSLNGAVEQAEANARALAVAVAVAARLRDHGRHVRCCLMYGTSGPVKVGPLSDYPTTPEVLRLST